MFKVMRLEHFEEVYLQLKEKLRKGSRLRREFLTIVFNSVEYSDFTKLGETRVIELFKEIEEFDFGVPTIRTVSCSTSVTG